MKLRLLLILLFGILIFAAISVGYYFSGKLDPKLNFFNATNYFNATDFNKSKSRFLWYKLATTSIYKSSSAPFS